MKVDYRVIDVVPHGEPMSLLEEITNYTDESLEAAVTIRNSSMFYTNKGVPAWVGIEYMGQAIAAWAGVAARLEGQSVKVGFLVSCRRYESPLDYFPLGSELRVSATRLTGESPGLMVFECAIQGEEFIIKANLNVFMPSDLSAYLGDSE